MSTTSVEDLAIENIKIRRVEKFKDLGSVISDNASSKKDVLQRMGKKELSVY